MTQGKAMITAAHRDQECPKRVCLLSTSAHKRALVSPETTHYELPLPARWEREVGGEGV
jgi:hypothetical protein